MKKLHLIALIVILAVALRTPAASTGQVYFNDFSTSVGDEWSSVLLSSLLITTAPSSEKFLGTNAAYGLSANTVTLTLQPLPAHSSLTLDLDLYIIQSWDGNSATVRAPGPDRFKLSIAGSTLLDTSFSNITLPEGRQSYPGNYPAGDYPRQTGAAATNTLQYSGSMGGDATYHLTYTVPHTAASAAFDFQAYGLGLQGVTDESWGLDNVQVEANPVPLPSTLLLLGSGLLGLAGWRRFKKPGSAISSAGI